MNDSRGSRRAFLKNTALASGGAWLGLQMSDVLAAGAAAAAHDGEHWKVLSATEVAGLGAVADQVFPPTDTPGAVDIGAVRFMDVALGGFMAGMLPMVQAGLADLDLRAQAAGAATFAALPFGEQTKILQAIENTAFFGNVRFLTLCGLFALPSQGGNIDRAGWKALEFEARHAWVPPFGHYDAEYAAEGVNHGV